MSIISYSKIKISSPYFFFKHEAKDFLPAKEYPFNIKFMGT